MHQDPIVCNTPQELADAIDAASAKMKGRGYTVRCPAHDDKDPSLDIDLKDGTLLYKCRAGCAQKAVTDAIHGLGISVGARQKIQTIDRGPMPRKLWVYPAIGGVHLRIKRTDTPDGKKRISQSTSQDGRSWADIGLPTGSKLPLYGAPFSRDKRILVVEGEKAMDAAQSALGDGWAVTCWPGGAGAVSRVEGSMLAGHDVSLWPDNDAPGIAAMEALREAILPVVGRLSMVDVRDMPAKGDAADIADEDIIEIVHGATPFDRLADLRIKYPHGTASKILMGDNGALDFPIPSQIIEGLLLDESICLIVAAPMAGKTNLMLEMMRCISTGTPFFGHRVTRPRKCAFFAGEAPASVAMRIRASNAIGRTFPPGMYGIQHAASMRLSSVESLEFESLVMDLIKNGIEVLFVDTLHVCSLLGVDENDAMAVGKIFELYRELIRRTGITVVISHHSNKANRLLGGRQHARGSSVMIDSVTTAFSLEAKGDGLIELTCTKQKDLPIDEKITLRVTSRELPEHLAAESINGRAIVLEWVPQDVAQPDALPGAIRKRDADLVEHGIVPAIMDMPVSDACSRISVATIRAMFCERMQGRFGSQSSANSIINRCIKDMVVDGLIEVEGYGDDRWMIIRDGGLIQAIQARIGALSIISGAS